MSEPKKDVFLQYKHSYSIRSKDSNTISSNKKPTKIISIKGPWTYQENQLLIDWINKNGPKNWTKCAQFIKGRTGKQCREHWNNSLNTEIQKGQWTTEEDLLIMIFYKKFNGSWKKMIPIFKSRTENSIKNRFFSQLRKIASKYIKTGKREYSTKFGLETLLKYYGMGVEQAKKTFFKKNKMNNIEFEDYIHSIEALVNKKPKGQKFIDLETLKSTKGINIISEINIDINESEDEFNKKSKKKNKKEENLQTNIKKKKKEKSEKNVLNSLENINSETVTFEINIKSSEFEEFEEKEKEKEKIKDIANIRDNDKKNKFEKNKNEIEKVKDNNNINNNIEKMNFLNSNINNNLNYNINNMNNNIKSNINYNNSINSTFNSNINNNINYNINNFNFINDNNNIANNLNNNINNYYTINNVRNNNIIVNNNFNKYKIDMNNNYYNLFNKKSSDLSEIIKKNDSEAFNIYSEDNQKPKDVTNNYVFRLLNAPNTNYFIDNNNNNIYDYNNKNSGFLTLQSGKISNANIDDKKYLPQFTPISPNFDNKFLFPFNYKYSDSFDFNKGIFNNIPQGQQYGFNKLASFSSM